MTKEEQIKLLKELKSELEWFDGVLAVDLEEDSGYEIPALRVRLEPWVEERRLPLQDPRIGTDWGLTTEDFKILWVWFE